MFTLVARRRSAAVALLFGVACSRARPAEQSPTPASRPEAAGSASDSSPTVSAPDRSLVREYRGAYTRGFEASWFVPCEAATGDALWWVTLTDDALRQRDSLMKAITAPPSGSLAVRWRGTISPRMPAGQMGRGTRYMLVTEVLEVRPASGATGACVPGGRGT